MTDKIKVITINKQKAVKIPPNTKLLLRRCVAATLKTEGFKGSAEVSITFVDNKQIRKYNNQYRGKDSVTDVLSFPMGENGVYDIDPTTGAQILGDVVISLEKAQEQASLFGHDIRRELGYLTVHSVLHLLGYDHMRPIEKMQMRDKEETIMNLIGLPSVSGYEPT